MISHLEKSFAKIGAKVSFVDGVMTDQFGRTIAQPPPVRLNILTKNKEEYFEIAVRADHLDLSVLEVRPDERHLVLLARELGEDGTVIRKDHFLCGYDERHLFVASVEPSSTVAAAKASLKPAEIRNQETGMSAKKSNRRKTQIFKRQGEWFFIPSDICPDLGLVRKDEPLRRGRGKAHMAQFAYRTGGETVQVCREYPNGLTLQEYSALMRTDKRAIRYSWRTMQRNAGMFVKGRIKHADHATLMLPSWHRVLMNTERTVEAVAFLD